MDDKILQQAISSGIIDVAYIQEQLNMKKREELLALHPYKIWKANDGLWNTYIPSGEGRVRKRCKTKEGIEKIIVDYWEKESVNPTILDAFNEWNNRRLELKKISPNTYERNYQVFKRYFISRQNEKIGDISPLEFSDFLEEQISKFNLTSKAFSNLKSICKGFLLRAKKQGYIDWNILDVFNNLDISEHDFAKTIKEDYEEVFNEDETNKIMTHLCSNLDCKNLGIILMFLTGVRVGELVSLKKSDFNEFTFKIRRTETRIRQECGGYLYDIKEYPKTPAGIRTMIIPKSYWWICNKLMNINPNSEFIFVDEKGKRLTTNCIRRRLERICKTLNIYNKSPHKIRKTYGTILMDNNVDRNVITGLMGHADIEISEKHYHRNRKDISKKLDIISSIPDFATPVATVNVL